MTNLSIGSIIRGNLRIKSLLGSGGVGSVYLAENTDVPDIRYAVKALRTEYTDHPRFHDRFFGEARNQCQLDHPNIVRVQDFFEHDDGSYCLVLSYVDGKPLNDLIADKGRLPEKEALEVFSGILQGLDCAHQHGIVHRDVKPSNVLIDKSGRARLTDFGIAIRAGDTRLTHTGHAIGTPQYMSPEQIRTPQIIDHRTDVYSAGVVLFEMLTGKVPFAGDTEFAIEEQIVNNEPPNPRMFNSEIPEGLATIILKALHKDPNQRYQGCGEFLNAIRGYQLGSESRPGSREQRAGRQSRTLMWAATLAAALAIAGFFAYNEFEKAEEDAIAAADKARAEADKAKTEAEAMARAAAEARAKLEAEAKARADAEAKARADAEAKARADAEAKARGDAEAKARGDAEAKARGDAEAKARADAEVRARADAEVRARADAEAKARAGAEAKARADAEAKARAAVPDFSGTWVQMNSPQQQRLVIKQEGERVMFGNGSRWLLVTKDGKLTPKLFFSWDNQRLREVSTEAEADAVRTLTLYLQGSVLVLEIEYDYQRPSSNHAVGKEQRVIKYQRVGSQATGVAPLEKPAQPIRKPLPAVPDFSGTWVRMNSPQQQRLVVKQEGERVKLGIRFLTVTKDGKLTYNKFLAWDNQRLHPVSTEAEADVVDTITLYLQGSVLVSELERDYRRSYGGHAVGKEQRIIGYKYQRVGPP